MLAFPTLKTGSVVQYPLKVTESYSTDVLKFLGGDEQRYPTSPGGLRSWVVQLDLLDEAELRSVEAFFIANAGSLAVFSFTDPIGGSVVPNCYISRDSLRETFSGDLHSGITLIIQQGKA